MSKQPLKNDLDNVFEIQEYETNKPNKTTTVMNNGCLDNIFYNGGTAEGLKVTLQSMIAQDGSVLTCTVCGKSKDKAGNSYANRQMEGHVENMHVYGVVYECNSCEKTLGSKDKLHQHTSVHHK